MKRVRVLPDDLANQIAAGEVVERPASVVKELCENSVDAGARRVQIDVETGGIGLVRVTDDGSGMDREDATLSLLRHATSKIAALDDLRGIESFGFRGEALPSIASVSRLTLRTRRAADVEGTEITVEGGGPMVVGPCGMAAGTSVEVRDLFYNVPARRKFLRAVGTESAHVGDMVQSLALGQPGISVILSRDGRVVREWPRAASREERVRSVHADVELAACRGSRGPLTVEAFVSRPERARSGAAWLSMFVNGRPVRDRALARAVAQAYGSVLPPGRYPVGAVYLDLPLDLVDVNVHPQKAEVRFADGRAVSDALYRVISAELGSAFGLPPPDRRQFGEKKQRLYDTADSGALSTWAWTSAPGAAAASKAPLAQSTPAAKDPAFAPDGEGDPWSLAGDAPPNAPPAAPPEAPPRPYPVADERGRPRVSFGALRFVAQVRRTFLMCEADDGLYVVDQHAAAERVTFHKLRRGFEARAVAMQKLLFPELCSVSPADVALVEEAGDEIRRAGLEVEAAGPTSVAVHAVPKLLARAAPDRLVRDLLAELGRAGGRAYSGAIDLALATMACHGSVRAGDPVATEEAAALLAALDEVDFAGHCPHGRPIVMRIGWNELETRVGRR